MLRDLVESIVSWRKDCEVGNASAVKHVHDIGKFIDQLCKLGGILAVGDQLVDGLIWLVVAVVGWWSMWRWAMVWRVMRMIQRFEEGVGRV